MSSPPSVLVVDDERSIRLTVCLALRTAGFIAEGAACGEVALEKLGAASYPMFAVYSADSAGNPENPLESQ